jgi:hypothetical protein
MGCRELEAAETLDQDPSPAPIVASGWAVHSPPQKPQGMIRLCL